MAGNFYRSGQAAKLLGISSYHLRKLCEAGLIMAELTAGQQWRIPASEVTRLQREGIPEIPVESDDGDDTSYGFSEGEPDELPEGLLAAPSAELIQAAEEVRISENRLRKRRVEKEHEEVEDWFRERDRQQAGRDAAERQKAEVARAEQRRRRWLDSWIQYGLQSRPYDAPKETELEIHRGVQAVLADLDADQPRSTTERLVDAAVQKVLRPWKRQKEIRLAIEAAINRLPWEIRNGRDWVALKQEAWEGAVTAVSKMRSDASSSEMQEVAWLAVQPMARVHAQWKASQDLTASIFLPGGSFDELQQARAAVREALARLPVGVSQKELEKTKEATLEPCRAVIAKRKANAQQREEQERRERERALQLATVESRVDLRLTWHLENHIRKLENDEEIECDGAADRCVLERDLKKRIRAMLVTAVRARPDMSDDEIDGVMEDLVGEHIEEFLDD